MAYRYHDWTNFYHVFSLFWRYLASGMHAIFMDIPLIFSTKCFTFVHYINGEHWKPKGSLGLFEINETRLTHFSSLYNLHRFKYHLARVSPASWNSMCSSTQREFMQFLMGWSTGRCNNVRCRVEVIVELASRLKRLV